MRIIYNKDSPGCLKLMYTPNQEPTPNHKPIIISVDGETRISINGDIAHHKKTERVKIFALVVDL